MHGDFTRFTHKPGKHFTQTLKQQGRVDLDADWNEQVEIQTYLDRTQAKDVIGLCGAPKTGGGFGVTGVALDGNDLLISAGRIYVDGILCELETAETVSISAFPADNQVQVSVWDPDDLDFQQGQRVEIWAEGVPAKVFGITQINPGQKVLTLHDSAADFHGTQAQLRRVTTYSAQPDHPNPPDLAPQDGQTDLVYLDVWERHITAIEDPDIREVALGGPDTTTRVQTAWQVKVLTNVGDVTCTDQIAGWPPPPSDGRLTTEATQPPASADPCTLSPGGGFRGLENHLYRVEIHDGSVPGPTTFKWSRDNGSVFFAVEEFIAGDPKKVKVKRLGRDRVLALHVDDWVEVLDDAKELSGEPGTLAQITDIDEAQRILTLSKSVSGYSVSDHAKVRRWDQKSDAVPVAAGPISLEYGIQIQFAGSGFKTGDYWAFAARTATADVEELVDAPPQGIEHHYCPLAVVTWKESGGQLQATVEDCRPEFPPLTDIWAEDVYFDNGKCQLVDTETVQDALDRLCAANDLRHHNKHLHGWGIVCGLQVACGPDKDGAPWEHITVRTGYAIDCEGNDLLIDQDEILNLMDRVRRIDRANPETPILDEGGDGEVCLTLELDEEAQTRYGLEPYDPNWWKKSPQSLLAGTLLMDFYEDCIRRIQEFFRKQLTPPKGEEDLPAGPVQQRVAALTNVLAQPVNPQTGQRIFVSRREHEIIGQFYEDLRGELKSKTFCAMFENARPLPIYPFEELAMDTIFGKGQHVRLRLRPGGTEAYTVGPGLNPLKPSTTMNRYDLQKNVLVAQIDPLAGAEVTKTKGDTGAGAVQDVAFSPDGRRIYVIVPTRNDENTFFRVGQFDRKGNIKWQPVVTICGVKLVTLATTVADREHVYAIGMKKETITEEAGGKRTEVRGAGLYRINPDNVDPTMEPLVSFNAFGHLEITAGGRAFATAKSDPNVEPTTYNQIVGIMVPEGAPLFAPIDLGADGSDDIALYTLSAGTPRESGTIYSVVGLEGEGAKFIRAHDLISGKPILDEAAGAPVAVEVDDSTIRLEPFSLTDMLLITSEDGYCVTMIDMGDHRFVEGYLLPTQVGPIAIASDAESKRVYVLNYVSNTILTAAYELFKPEFHFDMAALARYRKGVIEAFADLLGGFLQYLKDCFCDHFLVNCPQCDEEEKLYLACVSIRENQVYRVCNFSRRRYVKSFPTIGYWLSVVPIIPILDWLVAQFCGLILPDLFGRYTVPEYDEEVSMKPKSRVRVGGLRRGITPIQMLNIGAMFGEISSKSSVVGGLMVDALRQPMPAPAPAVDPALATSNIVNQPADKAEAQLKERGIEVQRETYRPSAAPDLTANLARFLRTPAPGSEVTIYEEGGRVRYYTVSDVDPTRELRAQVTSLSQSLKTREDEIQKLRDQVETQRADTAEVLRLQKEVNILGAELSRSQQTHQETIAARDQEISTLKETMAKLQADLTGLGDLRSQVDLLKRRPPSEPE